jgi:hypothetical protein
MFVEAKVHAYEIVDAYEAPSEEDGNVHKVALGLFAQMTR